MSRAALPTLTLTVAARPALIRTLLLPAWIHFDQGWRTWTETTTRAELPRGPEARSFTAALPISARVPWEFGARLSRAALIFTGPPLLAEAGATGRSEATTSSARNPVAHAIRRPATRCPSVEPSPTAAAEVCSFNFSSPPARRGQLPRFPRLCRSSSVSLVATSKSVLIRLQPGTQQMSLASPVF